MSHEVFVRLGVFRMTRSHNPRSSENHTGHAKTTPDSNRNFHCWKPVHDDGEWIVGVFSFISGFQLASPSDFVPFYTILRILHGKYVKSRPSAALICSKCVYDLVHVLRTYT